MLRFTILALAALFLNPSFAGALTASSTSVSLLASSDNALSFKAYFDDSLAAFGKTIAGQKSGIGSTIGIPVDESSSINVHAICFLVPPGTKARLISNSLTLGAKV